MNYIRLAFALYALGYILGSVFAYFFPVLGKIVRSGKLVGKEQNTLINKLFVEVPKSNCRHFHRIAVVVFTYALYQITSVYIFASDAPPYLINFLSDASGNEQRSIEPTHVYVAVCLMALLVYRKFYETHFVSIFSKSGKINILQYSLGMLYYPGAALALLSLVPKFVTKKTISSNYIDFSKLTHIDYIAIALFLWAWYHQHTTSKILANLRKNEKGEVVTSEHKLPFGDWFEFLSSPLQIAEILTYTSIAVILEFHITWLSIWALVLSNQVGTIWLTHRWYKSSFKNFPKNRKRFIPFVY